ncbi:hypothetical protein [Brevibacillus borstelensis]|uniref:hypothetical protein n=1 Tax=Brevibacillus borstelensis TaxID=45462 RepID=UPI0004F35ED5|nr:hypothetical protein [Brevibacillus borstelensis]KKX53018.1 hypothetical protein X546_20895 [Brevibacillus borstelensis cifa_chp40]
MRFKTSCSNCNHAGGYNIHHLVEEVDDLWCLACEKCGNRLLTFSPEERQQIIRGIQLTESYLPDTIDAYRHIGVDPLPSRVRFGVIASEENEE